VAACSPRLHPFLLLQLGLAAWLHLGIQDQPCRSLRAAARMGIQQCALPSCSRPPQLYAVHNAWMDCADHAPVIVAVELSRAVESVQVCPNCAEPPHRVGSKWLVAAVGRACPCGGGRPGASAPGASRGADVERPADAVRLRCAQCSRGGGQVAASRGWGEACEERPGQVVLIRCTMETWRSARVHAQGSNDCTTMVHAQVAAHSQQHHSSC
jgi:hypothetical protein